MMFDSQKISSTAGSLFRGYLSEQVVLIKWLLLLMMCGGPFQGIAQNCELPALQADYQRLRATVDAREVNQGLQLGDSLLQILREQDRIACPIYGQIKYEIGEVYELSGQMEKALAIYQLLVQEAEAENRWILAAETYLSIARVYEKIRRTEDCVRYLFKARELAKQHNLPATFSRFAVRYASYLRYFVDRDSAIVYAQMAIDLGKQYDVEASVLDGNLLMGKLAETFAEGLPYFQNAVQINLKRKNLLGAAGQKMNIAKALYIDGQADRAHLELDTTFLYLSLVEANTGSYYNILSLAHSYRHQLYRDKRQIDSAYFHLEKSLEAAEKTTPVADLSVISGKEISFAVEQEQQKLAFEKERSKLLRWGLVISALFLLLMTSLFIGNIRKNRQILKQNELIQAQNIDLDLSVKRYTTLLSEVHHRVKNNLQIISSLLAKQARLSNDVKLQQIVSEGQERIQSMALIHQNLYQSDLLSGVNVNSYLSELSENIIRSYNKEGIEFKLEADNEQLDIDTAIPVGLILNELITNAYKYAFPTGDGGLIKVEFYREANLYLLRVSDNGVGLSIEENLRESKTLGVNLVQGLVRQLGGEIDWGKPQDGAQITIKFEGQAA